MATASELEQGLIRQGDIQTAFPQSSEKTVSNVFYNPLAAKRLAGEYLGSKRNEPPKYIKDLKNPDTAYIRGRMDTRARVLVMIGQAELLTLDERTLDLFNPPMRPIRPVSEEEISELKKSYEQSKDFLTSSGFRLRPITRISAEEAEAKGQMDQLKICLFDFGITNNR